jgi:hypothetical protein
MLFLQLFCMATKIPQQQQFSKQEEMRYFIYLTIEVFFTALNRLSSPKETHFAARSDGSLQQTIQHPK